MYTALGTALGLRAFTTVSRRIVARSLHSRPAKMASTTAELPYKMHVTPDNTGLWRIKQTEDAARTATELLQQDMEVTAPSPLFSPSHSLTNSHQKHHVFFNEEHFHNHVRYPFPLFCPHPLYLPPTPNSPPDPAPPPRPLRHRRPPSLPQIRLHHQRLLPTPDPPFTPPLFPLPFQTHPTGRTPHLPPLARRRNPLPRQRILLPRFPPLLPARDPRIGFLAGVAVEVPLHPRRRHTVGAAVCWVSAPAYPAHVRSRVWA